MASREDLRGRLMALSLVTSDTQSATARRSISSVGTGQGVTLIGRYAQFCSSLAACPACRPPVRAVAAVEGVQLLSVRLPTQRASLTSVQPARPGHLEAVCANAIKQDTGPFVNQCPGTGERSRALVHEGARLHSAETERPGRVKRRLGLCL